MEVMLELYRTLETLGIEWREKRGVWSGDERESRAALIKAEQHYGVPVHSPAESEGGEGEGGDGSASYEADSRESLDIYYVEARWRLRQTVVSDSFALVEVLGTATEVEGLFVASVRSATIPSRCYELLGTFRPLSMPRSRSLTFRSLSLL